MSGRKRYVVVGTGGRCRMYIDAICGDYAEHAELVGLCDISETRAKFWQRHVAETYAGKTVDTYHADDFDRMVREQKADAVIVCTMDCVHHQYIIRAMELGCDAITEKPMTIDLEKATAIREAIQRTGKQLRVIFNYRYIPEYSKIREIVESGEIGTPTHVDFQWYLDTSHGADYFRRWHREMSKSGGLLVHKATHHFDLVNFWLGSYADTVFAMGGLKFYGRENAERRGEKYAYQRYTGSPEAANDPFALFIDGTDGLSGPAKKKDQLTELFYAAEDETGYIRDRNVFGDDPPITIYDTHAVLVRYRNNATLNYSMYAYSPWEGKRVTICGTKGQLEYGARGAGHIIRGQSDEDLAAEQAEPVRYLRVQRLFEPARMIDVPRGVGGHGGGDTRLLERMFLPDPPADPLARDATHVDGTASILIGIAANQSIETGQPVRLDDLMRLERSPGDAGAARSTVG